MMSASIQAVLRTLRERGFGPVLAVLTIIAGAAMAAGCASQAQKAAMAGGAGTMNVAPGSSGDFSHNVGNKVLFLTDSATLTPQARSVLTGQAKWLKQYAKFGVTIEGHADERGTREYNLGLAARRAAAVKSYLAGQGIPIRRLNTISYGKERPVATCDNISCWSQNRRAVTSLSHAG